MAFTQHPFRSERLFFRNIEERDHEFFHELQEDVFSFDLSTPSLTVPAARTMTTKVRESFTDSILGVLICLPTTDENLALAGEGLKKEDYIKPNLVRNESRDYGIPIGAMNLERQMSSPRYVHHSKGTIGIDIAPRFQKKGYGREALVWLLDWGFTQARFHRIQIRVVGWNPAAFRLYKSIGFKLESHEKESWWHNGKWEDDYGLALLEHEWREIRQSNKDSSQKTLIAGASITPK